MKAVHLTAASLKAFAFVDLPEPEAPERGRILVRMKTASFNFLDIAVANGAYPGAIYPNVPVADGAGEVIAVGEEVWQVAVGDRVAVHPKAYWIAGASTAHTASAMRGVNLRGSLVEIAELDAASVVPIPDHLSFEQGATLPIASTTSWNAMDKAGIGPGSTVVLLGTGGVSLFALQHAKARGARVVVTSSADDKLEDAMKLGADEGVNYRKTPAWNDVVRDLTNGIGADLVLETVGGESLPRSVAAVRQGGLVYLIGFLGGTQASVDLLALIGRAITIRGANTGSVADLAHAARAMVDHRIEPVIARIESVREIGAAYARFAEGGHFGKVAITLDW
ncbi:MAG: NAD(P)-dependent alcohol dehydrogenase [Pseudomonadota bacterium]|nr:NAD(P)-dependent alcohol dehydrogenase [Pseudomonadota bacterium]